MIDAIALGNGLFVTPVTAGPPLTESVLRLEQPFFRRRLVVFLGS